MKLNNKGFSAVETIAVVLILVMVGFVGWRVYSSQDTTDDIVKTETTSEQQAPADAPEVKDTEDLDEAEKYLQETDIDSELDTSEIDEALEQ